MTNNSYKLLIMDVDGTLVGKDGTISAEDREALTRARASGVRISLSTGRVPQACSRIIDQLDMDTCHIFFDGALVSNPDRAEEVYVQPLSEMLVRQAVEFARRYDLYLELYSTAHYFVERETWASDIHRQFFGIHPIVVDFTGIWGKERIIKGELLTSSPQEAARARRLYRQLNGGLRFSWAKSPAYPGIDFINVVDPQVSKGKALEVLVRHLGVSLSEVIAIGDGINDISLLTKAGLAIAMHNAPAEVKAVADYVTLDVENSGLAAAIDRFL